MSNARGSGASRNRPRKDKYQEYDVSKPRKRSISSIKYFSLKFLTCLFLLKFSNSKQDGTVS